MKAKDNIKNDRRMSYFRSITRVTTIFTCVASCLPVSGCYIKNKYPKYAVVIVHASFPRGKKALVHFVEQNSNASTSIPDSLNYGNDSFYEEQMSFTIDSLGSIVDTYATVWVGNRYTEQDMNHILGKMPKWLPGYRYNNKTKKKEYFDDYGGFSIKYYYESKRQYKK